MKNTPSASPVEAHKHLIQGLVSDQSWCHIHQIQELEASLAKRSHRGVEGAKNGDKTMKAEKKINKKGP